MGVVIIMGVVEIGVSCIIFFDLWYFLEKI